MTYALAMLSAGLALGWWRARASQGWALARHWQSIAADECEYRLKAERRIAELTQALRRKGDHA